MGKNRKGRTAILENPPSIAQSACIVGAKENEGPLRGSFDEVESDPFFGEKTWEKAESRLQNRTLSLALKKAGLTPADADFVFAGDLMAQCIGSSFGLRDFEIPLFGVYGACSTMAESLALASMTVSAGYGDIAAAVTSSHFCTAERQFRQPLEYGNQRTPTAQWTVTGSGACIVTSAGNGPYVNSVTCGKIVDLGIKDANNMGAAMAPAAFDTLRTHLRDMNITPEYYDMIVTGDLGIVGSDILRELFRRDGIDISSVHRDCGAMIFDPKTQDTHSGGSGCGCSGSVLCGYLMNGMRAGKWKRILFAATGALMSTVSSQQGESIPGICCAVSISGEKEQ